MFDRIKRIFKKNKSNEVGIITLDNIVSVPNRKDLMDDKKSIEKIDKYKTDYLKILTNKNTLTSHKLGEYNHISEKVRMYTDIYTSISLDDDELFEYTISNKDELVLRKVDIKNKLLKINLYLNDLERLEKEIMLHLIALKEIRGEKVFFSGLRKRPIDEEINTLMMSLINVISQKRAISIDTSTALKKHELLNILNDEVDKEEAELINSNYECLKRLTSKLNINNENNINTNNKLIMIAQMDKSIEEYAYNNKLNKDELLIDILKEQLNNLKDKLSKSDNPESYMSLIKYYERKCIKYKKEGLITEDEMTLLYELKFYILTSNINSKDKINIIEESTADEFEYYKKIMANILKTIFTSNETATFVNEFRRGIYETIHKDIDGYKYTPYIDYTRFKYYDIFRNKEILSFLLGIYEKLGGLTDSKNTLENFFDTLVATPGELSVIDSKLMKLTFNKDTPKSTAFMLVNIAVNLYNENAIKEEAWEYYRWNIYYLAYDLFCSKSYIDMKGINSISLKKYRYCVLLIEKIFNSNVSNNNLCLSSPSTLQKINGPFFKSRTISKMVLNEGLEKLTDSVFKDATILDLTLPSTLRKIDDTVFDKCIIHKLTINDVDKLQLDDDSLSNLLLPLVYIDYDTDFARPFNNIRLKNNVTIILTLNGKTIEINSNDFILMRFDLRDNVKSNIELIKDCFKDLINKKLKEQENEEMIKALK